MPPKRPLDRLNDIDHKDLTKHLIAAIEAAQRCPPRSSSELARRADNKLQYDFPLLEVAELEALSDAIRGSLGAKGGLSQTFQITSKLVENVTQGALGSAAHGTSALAGASNSQQQQPQATLAQPSPETQRARAAYQQLCVSVLVLFVNGVLSAPEGEAWRLLSAYVPPLEDGADEDGDAVEGNSSSFASQHAAGMAGDRGFGADMTPEAVVAAMAAATAGDTRGQPTCVVFEDTMADCEDDDSMAYEPLDQTPTAPTQITASTLATASQQRHRQQLQQESPGLGQVGTGVGDVWHALRPRLLHLASPEHLVALASRPNKPQARGSAATQNAAPSADSAAPEAAVASPSGEGDGEGLALDVWSDMGVTGAVLSLLRTAGVHERAKDLQPLVASYVGLLVDRVASHPSEVEAVLEQLWDALGVKGLAAMPRGAGRRGGAVPAVLPSEASVAFTTICNLSAQVASSSQARGAVWRQVHGQLLGIVERCLCDLAAGGPASANPQTLAAVSLTCQVVSLYMELAPGNANPAATLMSGGIVRALSLLLPIYGDQPGAETLRAAVTLSASSSPDVRKWMLAVPGVAHAIATRLACSDSALPHAVVWRLLEPQALATAAAAPSAQKTGLAASQPPPQQRLPQGLSDVLQQGVEQGDTQALGRMHAVLSLMVRCGQVPGRKGAWGRDAEAALRKASGALREAASHNRQGSPALVATQSTAPSGDAAVSGDAAGGGSDAGAGNGTGQGSDEEMEEVKGHRAGGAVALQERRVHQLRPACVKLIKQLLTMGGKTD